MSDNSANPQHATPGPVAATGAILVSVGLIALLTRLIDTLTEASQSADRLVVIGAVTIALGTLLLLIARRRAQLGKLLILSLGLSPFTIFGLFLVWRIGLSAEQFEACTEEDDAVACRTLAERRANRDKIDDALVLYERGCALGDGRSCVELAGLLRRVPQDGESQAAVHARSLELYQRACDLDQAIGCDNAGRMLREDDPDEALRWYARGCELAYPASCAAIERAARAE